MSKTIYCVTTYWERKTYDGTYKVEQAIRAKTYDDVSNQQEALGRCINDVISGANNVKGYSLSMWQVNTFIIEEPKSRDQEFKELLIKARDLMIAVLDDDTICTPIEARLFIDNELMTALSEPLPG